MTNTIQAWHFTDGYNLRCGTPLEVGRTYEVDPPLKLCKIGLHASIRPIDALNYAPGDILSRVECAGEIITGEDKLVCSRRTVLWTIDAEPVLRKFARRCAWDVIDLWDAAIVRKYLETGSESIRAEAWAETWAETRDASRDAAGAAARDAARDAAGAAARDAAWAAARAAAWDAARDAARAAAWDAQNDRLEQMLTEAVKPCLPLGSGR